MREYTIEQNNPPRPSSGLPTLPSRKEKIAPPPEDGSLLKWLLYTILLFILFIVLVMGGLAGYAYYKHGNFDIFSVIFPDNSASQAEITLILEEEETNTEDNIKTEGITEEEGEKSVENEQEDEAINEEQNPLINPEEKEEYESCISQGGIISTTTIRQGRSSECCAGLSLILERPDRFDKAYCLNCGNGVCEPPETYENCPSDCIKEMTPEELATDTDFDGLMDFEEDWYGTNPRNNDTDSDGYSDGEELKLGFDPGGYGSVTADQTTPEGAIFALEYAKVKCEQNKIKDKLYFSKTYFNRLISYYSILEAWEDSDKDEHIAELRQKITDEFLDPRVFVNRVDKINFLERKPRNYNQLLLNYEVIYSPDDRGYIPGPVYSTLILTYLDGEWLYDLAATEMEEIENTAIREAKTRDSKRLADIKQIQVALELYYNEVGRYPETVTSLGRIEYNGNIYMLEVPENLKVADGSCPVDFEYKYTPKDSGQAYTIEYCLGMSSGEIPSGINFASPDGIGTADDNPGPAYKTCYFDAESRDNARIADIKEIQTALELYYNDVGNYPKYILPGIPLMNNETTYLSGMPKAPPAESGSCELYSEYSYNQANDGQAYELRYCLEEGVGIIPAGINTAGPGGISE